MEICKSLSVSASAASGLAVSKKGWGGGRARKPRQQEVGER